MLKKVLSFADKNSPAILTTLGAIGVITTTASAITVTPKAYDIVKKASEEIKASEHWSREERLKNKSLSPADKRVMKLVKDVALVYAPTIILGSATILCIINANRIASKRTMAIASLYSLAEKDWKQYKDKANEIIGEKKMQKVRDAVEQSKTDNFELDDNNIVVTGRGETLCFETLTGRYFRSDIESIRKTVNDLNFELLNSMYVSLNQLYVELGLERIDMGDEIGWTVDDIIEPTFTCMIAKNGSPCLILSFNVNPKYDFKSLW